MNQISRIAGALLLFVGGLFELIGHPGDGIVVDSRGTIYFVARNPLHDTNHHACIYRFKQGDDKPTAFYTSPHPSSNVFIVQGLDGKIYGSERNYLGEQNGNDTFTTKVWQFEENGHKTEVLPPRSGRSPYGGPAYLVDEKGTFLFANGATIRKRTPDGEESLFFGKPERQNEENHTNLDQRIFGLAWGARDEIYILRIDRVEVLGLDQTLRTLYTGLKNLPFDISVDESGNVYLPDWRARKVYRASDGGELTTIRTTNEPWGAEGGAIRGGKLVILEFTGPPSTKILARIVQFDGSKSLELYRFD